MQYKTALGISLSEKENTNENIYGHDEKGATRGS